MKEIIEIIKPLFYIVLFWICCAIGFKYAIHSANATPIDPYVSQQVTREININGQQCTITILRVDSITTEGFHIVCPQTCK